MNQRSRSRRLTDHEIAQIREWWGNGVSASAICEMLHMTRDAFDSRRLDQLADLPIRKRGVGKKNHGAPDPTPDEIAERSAAIRARWTESERLQRLACGKLPPIRERRVSGGDLSAAYRSL
jgi:hypothetical protein